MKNVINFYYVTDEFGCFSNFAPFPVKMGGNIWPTAEHYFQAQKFTDLEQQEKIRMAKSPSIAAQLGRDRSKPIRLDWEAVKVSVMREVVQAKFLQHADIRQVLLSTMGAQIVEHTQNDSFWGDGGDGSGRNMLGEILMDVRQQFNDNDF